MTTTKRQAKKKLSDLTFEHEGAHIALTAKSAGGPANAHDYALVLKSNKFSKEAIEKMQQVQVTLELPEFLRRFFDMYYTDSEVLARLMGYVPSDNTEDVYDSESYYTERLSAFTVMKSLHESGDILKGLALLNEDEYVSLLENQAEVEKAFAELDKVKQESDSVVIATESDNSTNAGVEKSVEPSGSKVNKSKKEIMPNKNEKATDVEVVEKSALEALQKSLDEKAVELQKALDTIAQFEAAQKEALVKSKIAQITALIKDEKISAPIIKAGLTLESDDDFGAFLAAIQAMASNIETTQEFMEKSALFAEQGATVSDSTQEDSAVARILKARHTK